MAVWRMRPACRGKPLEGLAQQFQAGLGEEGVRAAGGFQGMLDQLCEAFPFEDGLQLHPNLEAPGQGRIGDNDRKTAE